MNGTFEHPLVYRWLCLVSYDIHNLWRLCTKRIINSKLGKSVSCEETFGWSNRLTTNVSTTLLAILNCKYSSTGVWLYLSVRGGPAVLIPYANFIYHSRLVEQSQFSSFDAPGSMKARSLWLWLERIDFDLHYLIESDNIPAVRICQTHICWHGIELPSIDMEMYSHRFCVTLYQGQGLCRFVFVQWIAISCGKQKQNEARETKLSSHNWIHYTRRQRTSIEQSHNWLWSVCIVSKLSNSVKKITKEKKK